MIRRFVISAGLALGLVASFLTRPAYSQDAIVTFYSHGSLLTSGLPGGKDIFIGSIFDGKQSLFVFRDGFFAHNNRFLTLRFAPGQHTFGGSYWKRPKSSESLSVELKAGQRYFIWATGDTEGLPGVFTVSHARLELVDCSDAQADMAKAKPSQGQSAFEVHACAAGDYGSG